MTDFNPLLNALIRSNPYLDSPMLDLLSELVKAVVRLESQAGLPTTASLMKDNPWDATEPGSTHLHALTSPRSAQVVIENGLVELRLGFADPQAAWTWREMIAAQVAAISWLISPRVETKSSVDTPAAQPAASGSE